MLEKVRRTTGRTRDRVEGQRFTVARTNARNRPSGRAVPWDVTRRMSAGLEPAGLRVAA